MKGRRIWSQCLAKRRSTMKRQQFERETERVITRVLPLVPKDKAVEKGEFEAILNVILACVHENTKIRIDVIGQKTKQVISDLPKEYGRLPRDVKSWETLIGYLYGKYLKELRRL
jgi:hypothetical protein